MTKTQSKMTVRGIVFSALFGALMVVMSFVQLHLGFTPVPVTLETMALMLAGALLGARYGFFSIFTVIVLVALGIPLLHGQGGLALILGPTGGFIWMFPISTLLIGFFTSRVKGSNWLASLKICFILILFGSLLLYVTGVPWLAYKLNLTFHKAMLLGCYPYLIGDMLKAIAATIIIIPIRRLYPSWTLTGSGDARVVDLRETSKQKQA